jgi:hypothetical protein
MEVHHPHHHSSPRSFRQYAGEFLMIFLAVTLGFFAENIREHFAEKEKAHQYLEDLVSDLKQDTAKLNASIAFKLRKQQQVDSLINLLLGPERDAYSKEIYYYARMLPIREPFYATEGTLSQMENDGGFRILHNKEIIEKINHYIASKHKIVQIQNLEDNLSVQMRTAANKIFDARVFEAMLDPEKNSAYRYYIRPPEQPAPFTSKEPRELNEYANWVVSINTGQTMNRMLMLQLKEEATALIIAIEKTVK